MHNPYRHAQAGIGRLEDVNTGTEEYNLKDVCPLKTRILLLKQAYEIVGLITSIIDF